MFWGGDMSADTALAAEPPTQGQGASFTYDAFLSYNHQDGAVAAGIHKGLHRIGRRMGQLNALRVFRDSTDLAANPNLWGKVTDAMDRSRYLIVVLSPRAAAVLTPAHQIRVDDSFAPFGGFRTLAEQRGGQRCVLILRTRRS